MFRSVRKRNGDQEEFIIQSKKKEEFIKDISTY